MITTSYATLSSIVFSGHYPGYRPDVLEKPHGDERVDAEKRYAHVVEKYLARLEPTGWERSVLEAALDEAHWLSLRVAKALRVPEAFMPRREHGALRVLEYPVGAISNVHTDFDLFTLMMYRDQPEKFFSAGEVSDAVRALNSQAHLGELAELLGLGRATPHLVLASETVQQSVVYFAIPDHSARLPSGVTVGEWLAERMSRSRVYT